MKDYESLARIELNFDDDISPVIIDSQNPDITFPQKYDFENIPIKAIKGRAFGSNIEQLKFMFEDRSVEEITRLYSAMGSEKTVEVPDKHVIVGIYGTTTDAPG